MRKTLALPYRPEDLFDLVCDVRAYPDFIEWVRTLDILRQEENGQNWQARAATVVAFAGFRQSFTTDIHARRDRLTIDVTLYEGPFRYLRNTWRFCPSDSGGRADFMIDFSFKNRILRLLSLAHADRVGTILAHRFTDEAERRYGRQQEPEPTCANRQGHSIAAPRRGQ